jgi:branched-chain amino acid transport system substrate-binding protein
MSAIHLKFGSLRSRERLGAGAFLAATAVLTSALVGCSSSGHSAGGGGGGGGSQSGGGGSTYHIAEIADLTGNQASSDLPFDAGLQAYIKSVNASGGVGGHKLSVAASDSQTVTNTAVANLQKALSGSPIAIVHAGNGVEVSAMEPLLKQANVAMLTIAAPDEDVYPAQPNVFMIQATATQQATASAKEAQTLLGGSLTGKKIAFLGLQGPYIDDFVKALTSAVKSAGGTVTTPQRFPATATSFASQASLIADSKPDAVVVTGTDAITVAPVTALADAGVSAPIIAYTADGSTANLQKVALANFYALRVATNPDPGTQIYQFAQQQSVASSATNSYFSQGLEAGALIVSGLQHCGDGCTAAKLRTTLDGLGSVPIPQDALYGPLQVSATNHALLTAGQFYRWDKASSAVAKAGGPISLG